MFQLAFIIVSINVKPELDLLDLLRRQILFLLVLQLLFLLIAKLSEIHDPADRRNTRFRNQNKIQFCFLSGKTGRTQSHLTQLFPVGTDHKKGLVGIQPVIGFQ